jgi:hypothetical protein
MLKHRFRLQVSLFVLALAASLLPAQAQNAADVYNKVKAAEKQLKLPTPHAVGTVGTLDAATGKFTGLLTTTEKDPQTGKPGKDKQFNKPTKDIVKVPSPSSSTDTPSRRKPTALRSISAARRR